MVFVPESRAERPRRVDPVGQVLVVVTLASLTYAIIEGPHSGWTSPAIAGLFALSVAGLAGLIAYEPRQAEPLLDFRFFRSAPFSGATLIAVSAFAAMAGFFFLNTLYLQDVRGLSALHAGLYLTPMAAMTLIFAPVSGRLTGRRGPRLPLLLAGAFMTAGGALMTTLSATTPPAWVLGTYFVFGIGFGLVNVPITNTAVSGMPSAQAGVAAAIASTSRQVGTSLGVAITGSVLSSALAGPLATGFVSASEAGWWIISGSGAAVLCLGVLSSGRWARATAARTADRISASQASAIPASGPG
jgi:predicted MFS family arabinose efflux permease